MVKKVIDEAKSEGRGNRAEGKVRETRERR